MRLIDTRTPELRSFNDIETTEYAILSHTWGSDEITYQELVWINRAKTLSTSFNDVESSMGSFSSQDEQSTLMLAAIEMMLRGNSSSSMRSIAEDDLMRRDGYNKLTRASEQALSLGFTYICMA